MRTISPTHVLPSLIVSAVIASSGAAHADSFLEAVGGFSAPIGDDTWTKTAESSPKLELRAGAMQDTIGGMLQVDWTPVNLDNMGLGFAAGSTDAAGHRFRVLADFAFLRHLAPKLLISARAGIGADIAHGSYSLPLLGSHSNTDVGFAFELGGGLWFDLGSVQLGGELALPIGYHSKQAASLGDIAFNYTSYDIDVLLGVRVFSR